MSLHQHEAPLYNLTNVHNRLSTFPHIFTMSEEFHVPAISLKGQ